jgi:ATP-binding cassette subfamily B protein
MLKQLAPLLPYAKRYRRRIAAGLGLVLFSNIFSLAWPYLLKLGIDDMEAGTTAARLAGYAGAIVLFSMIGGFGRFLIRELLNGMSRLVENDLRDDYFAHLLRLAPDFYGSVPTGELMSRATNDIPAVRMVIGPAIMYLVNTAVVAAIALTMLILIDLRLTLLAIIPLLAVPAVTICFGREIHKRFEAIQAQFGRISTMAQETLAGARIVRAYVQEESQAGAFAGLNREYMIRNLRLAKVWGLFHPMLMMLTGLGAVIVLGVGGRDVIMGRISVGDFVAFVRARRRIDGPYPGDHDGDPVHPRRRPADPRRRAPWRHRVPQRLVPLPGNRAPRPARRFIQHRAWPDRSNRWPHRLRQKLHRSSHPATLRPG